MSKADITSVLVDLGILGDATARPNKMPDYGSGSGCIRGMSTRGVTTVEVPHERSKRRRRSKKTLPAELQGEASTKDSFIAELRKLNRFLRTREVMTFLGIERRDTICKYVREGKLKAHSHIGNGYRFCPVYIADWIESRQV